MPCLPQTAGARLSCFLSGRAAQDVGVAAGSVRIGAAVPAELEFGDRIAVHFVRAVGQSQVAPRPRPRPAEVAADPGAACAWMARSITRSAMFGATTLIMAISARAALLPAVSIR